MARDERNAAVWWFSYYQGNGKCKRRASAHFKSYGKKKI